MGRAEPRPRPTRKPNTPNITQGLPSYLMWFVLAIFAVLMIAMAIAA